MQAPCKDCPDRKVGCHSICEKYISFSKARAEMREKIREAKSLENDYYSSFFRSGRGKRRK